MTAIIVCFVIYCNLCSLVLMAPTCWHTQHIVVVICHQIKLYNVLAGRKQNWKTFYICYSLRSWLVNLEKYRSLSSLVCRIIPVYNSYEAWLGHYCEYHEKMPNSDCLGIGMAAIVDIFPWEELILDLNNQCNYICNKMSEICNFTQWKAGFIIE